MIEELRHPPTFSGITGTSKTMFFFLKAKWDPKGGDYSGGVFGMNLNDSLNKKDL